MYQSELNRTIARIVESLPAPSGYEEVGRRRVVVDGVGAQLIRYERADGRNRGVRGEHFSIVIDESGLLRGFARIDAGLLGLNLPTKDEAQSIALDFLKEQSPDLLQNYHLFWVEAHDEPVRIFRQGNLITERLTGMKVKMQNEGDGLWFWTIVGPDRRVMVFERDIRWITFPGHRGTEKWLHDSWLIEKGYALEAA
jgi:hypothetical protein